MGVLNEQTARGVGLDVLLWLTADPERAGEFMRVSGTDVAEIRNRATDDEFLGFVLDYVLQGDEMVLEFCTLHRCKPEDVIRARAVLPGGNQPNWT